MSASTSSEVSKRGGKAKKRKEAQDIPPEKDVATKQEYEVARWMRKNVPMKKTKFLSHTVEYFTACKAVDLLMDSPWTQPAKAGEDPLFTTRESIVHYLDVMLRHKLFHRARKIVVPESELNKNKKKKQQQGDKDKDKETKEDSPGSSGGTKKDKKQQELLDKETTAAESSHAEQEKESDKSDKKKKKTEGDKKKRKVRLDMHLEQRFVDGLDAYVWIYEPTPFYYYFFGFLVVIAVIAVCLFPLWPNSVRQGVYYLSVAAAGFLVFILALAVIRVIVFGFVWCVTFGIHHVWLLPNLTEDVGFFQSFWPLVKYEYKGTPKDEEEEVEIVEVEEIVDDDYEAGGGNTLTEARPIPSSEETPEKNDSQTLSSKPNKSDGSNSNSNSETESEGSHPSQLEKDFEIVDRSEVDGSENEGVVGS